MKKDILRLLAVAMGLGACGIAQAQNGHPSQDTYVSPARWSNFQRAPEAPSPLQEDDAAIELPAPQAEVQTELSAPQDDIPEPQPMPESNGYPETNAYMRALNSTWGDTCPGDACATRLPLAPYFGSVNLLFLTLEENGSHPFATGLSDYGSTAVDPDSSTGFDVSAGRYLDGGRYGLGITYMLWDPDSEQALRTGAAGSISAAMPAYNSVSVDAGAGAGTVYAIIDGSDLNYGGATGARLNRDVRIQGIEANLFSFGLMGARRVSYADCNSGGHAWARKLGLHSDCHGYGGATGPLARACGGRVRVMTSHGLRWFQFNDELELGYNVDGAAGYQSTDIYENVDVENNLYGYQFGSQLTYCLYKRVSLNVGGKFGIYGNDVEKRHRLGTLTSLAYRTGVAADVVSTEDSDTVLATLGELDLGLGYRLSTAWTLRGGYRLLGATGVATAWDSLPDSYATLAESGRVNADDSLLLHGGYVGMEYNW